MLKKARYVCWSFNKLSKDPIYNTVVYLIKDDSCYFSGIDSRMNSSTSNSAEEIVETISKQEGISFKDLRWFDIQTYLGYMNIHPGKYEFNELIISDVFSNRLRKDRKFYVKNIESSECPSEILEHFKEYLG